MSGQALSAACAPGLLRGIGWREQVICAQHLCFQKPQDSNKEVEVGVDRRVKDEWL